MIVFTIAGGGVRVKNFRFQLFTRQRDLNSGNSLDRVSSFSSCRTRQKGIVNFGRCCCLSVAVNTICRTEPTLRLMLNVLLWAFLSDQWLFQALTAFVQFLNLTL